MSAWQPPSPGVLLATNWQEPRGGNLSDLRESLNRHHTHLAMPVIGFPLRIGTRTCCEQLPWSQLPSRPGRQKRSLNARRALDYQQISLPSSNPGTFLLSSVAAKLLAGAPTRSGQRYSYAFHAPPFSPTLPICG